ncbi:hypothetical protein [Anaerotruncus colihominis]|uniref:hypothetical protein n=1 Tax=Anaerotruncus colihominis TaxID=169435 RepID=UPI00351757F3
MTDKQRLVYDLSLLSTAEEMHRRKANEIHYLPADVLDTFEGMIQAFSVMDSCRLSQVMEALKKVGP